MEEGVSRHRCCRGNTSVISAPLIPFRRPVSPVGVSLKHLPRDCAIIAHATTWSRDSGFDAIREKPQRAPSRARRCVSWARTSVPSCARARVHVGGAHDTPRVAAGTTACATRFSEVMGKNHSAAPAWVSVGVWAAGALTRAHCAGTRGWHRHTRAFAWARGARVRVVCTRLSSVRRIRSTEVSRRMHQEKAGVLTRAHCAGTRGWHRHTHALVAQCTRMTSAGVLWFRTVRTTEHSPKPCSGR